MSTQSLNIGDCFVRVTKNRARTYRFLHYRMSIDRYYDQVVCVRANWFGAIAVAYFRFLERNWRWVAKYDRDSLDIKDGDFFPWWSGTYWLHLPMRFTNRFFPKVTLWN